MLDDEATSLVDRFVQNGGMQDVTEDARHALEQFLMKCHALALEQIATFPAEVQETFSVLFRDDPHVNAEGGSVGQGGLRIVIVTLGLIDLILHAGQSIDSDGPLRESVCRMMFFLALGHELGHITYGHNEGGTAVEDDEIRAMEAYADYWSGILLAQNVLTDAPDAEVEMRLAASLLSSTIFHTAIGGKKTDAYHSAPKRVAFLQAGFRSWVTDHCNELLPRLDGRLFLLHGLVTDLVRDEAMREKALALLADVARDDEDIFGTIGKVRQHMAKWERDSSLLSSRGAFLQPTRAS